MKRKFAIVLLVVLSAWMLLLLFSGCKARKVALKVKDSTASQSEASKTHTEESTVDRTKTSDIKIVAQTDSSTTTTIITPADGKIIEVNKDGSFKGEAKSVSTTTKKGGKINTQENKQINNDVKTDLKKDRSGQKKQSVTVHQKDKDVATKPDYSWIIYVVIGVIVLGAGVIFYFKKIA